MVMRVVFDPAVLGVLLAQQKDPVLEQLDPPRRAAVIMALLALVLTGLFLVLAIMLGAHWVRRLARHKPGAQKTNSSGSDSPNERWRDALRSVLPDVKTKDTIQLGHSPGDTQAD
jgi:hypothetical protein